MGLLVGFIAFLKWAFKTKTSDLAWVQLRNTEDNYVVELILFE